VFGKSGQKGKGRIYLLFEQRRNRPLLLLGMTGKKKKLEIITDRAVVKTGGGREGKLRVRGEGLEVKRDQTGGAIRGLRGTVGAGKGVWIWGVGMDLLGGRVAWTT